MSDSLMAVTMLAVILAVSAICIRIPGLAREVLNDEQGRIPGLDGLRGILSFSVFGHHCVAYRQLARTGSWGEPTGNVANLMGQGSVAIFFMISAYLFLGKIFRSGGRLDVPTFLWGRLTRLTPVYAIAVAGALLVAVALADFRLDRQWFGSLLAAPGWFGFGFLRRADLAYAPHSALAISPVWSLRYEWILYGLIIVAAFALQRRVPKHVVILGFVVLALLDRWFSYFALGGAIFLLVRTQLVSTLR